MTNSSKHHFGDGLGKKKKKGKNTFSALLFGISIRVGYNFGSEQRWILFVVVFEGLWKSKMASKFKAESMMSECQMHKHDIFLQ